jgi:hypothetical protein
VAFFAFQAPKRSSSRGAISSRLTAPATTMAAFFACHQVP